MAFRLQLLEASFQGRDHEMHSTRNKPFYLGVLSALATLVLAFPSLSDAAALIDFDQAAIPVSGTLSFDGGGVGVGTVTASAIAFDRIIGHDTAFNNESPLACLSCTLSFHTGTLTSIGVAGPITTYNFGGGGTVTLIGGVFPDPGGIPPHPGSPLGTVLATGVFTSASLVVGPGNTYTFLSNHGITDTKDTALVEYYYGIGFNTPPRLFHANTTELGGAGVFGPGGGFTSTTMQLADFNNELVPEPGTGLFLLLGVSALMARSRRKP